MGCSTEVVSIFVIVAAFPVYDPHFTFEQKDDFSWPGQLKRDGNRIGKEEFPQKADRVFNGRFFSTSQMVT
jgi:hypothetical protein